MMAADSDGCGVRTIVTCEGDLTDPTFHQQLEHVIESLQNLLGRKVHVCKLEPWNSVRVTLSIPREAALRLRHLATEGSQQLRALGILSVQVEGDQVISLRLAGPEPQEIILRTTQQDGNISSSTNAESALSQIPGDTSLSTSTVSTAAEKIQFRSPNVICPTDTVVPKVPSQSVASNSTAVNSRTCSGPFPFTSMNQAIHNNRDISLGTNYNTPPPPPPPPPPYPGKHPPITISSPLLVNLLQNDGATVKTCKSEPDSMTSNSNGALQTNGTIISTSAVKLSMSTSNVQDSPMKEPVSAPTMFLRKSVTNVTVKNNSVMSTPITQTTTNPVTTSSDLAPVLTNSHHTTNVSPSVSQCNSTTLISSSPESNNLLHNNAAINLPITSSVLHSRHSNVLLRSGIPKSTNSSKCTESQGSNHVSSKPQPRFSNSLPLTTVVTNSTNNSNILQLPNAVNISSSSTRTFSSFRPCPPPYSSHRFEPIAQPMPQLLEITPSLTELKATDLDQLLPSLERELARSPVHITEELVDNNDHCNYLVNPLTGELEPHVNNDSDAEQPSDIFIGLSSPTITSDEDTNSTSRPDTTDQSDSESRSAHSGDSNKNSRLKNIRNRTDRGRDSPSLKPTEKIKLRLKLEKSEPVSPAYKVDVSFINLSSAKKTPNVSGGGEELRVPPLHISLKGRNHVVINNRKKVKINNPDDSASKSSKIHKTQEPIKLKKSLLALKESPVLGDQSSIAVEDGVNPLGTVDNSKCSASSEQRKVKKMKSVHEHREQNLLTGGHLMDKDVSRSTYNSHFKERRGSDSELAHSTKRYTEANGILLGDKKRRLSHTDQIDVDNRMFVLGSTNTGTVTALPTQKIRKEKLKSKDSFKTKELNRSKSYAKNVADKLMKQISLPTGEIDMEAKFKQRLLEDSEKGISRPPYRTENVQVIESSQYQQQAVEKEDELIKTLSDPPPVKDKPPELIKNSVIDRKPDLTDKQANRSPNSGGQGEDSGIESMDALSEKSPNQASQSPHTDISETMKSKPQVPSILDIEAQLAKMEGLNGEDMNENKHNGNAKIEQCCVLTSALQDSLKQGAVSITSCSSPVLKDQLPQVEVSLVPLKASCNEEALEPTPIHMSPPLYTYSNPDKSRGSESSSSSDSDSNSCSSIKNKSLLEQLLIDIPDNQNPSSPSPVIRSLRTRASSKLSSPELNSPVPPRQTPRMPAPKRKRHESDSSSNSVEDARNKKQRKCSENAAELIKACMGVEHVKANVRKNKLMDDSSDSDEPLIEVAGKVRKNNINSTRAKFKSTSFSSGGGGNVSGSSSSSGGMKTAGLVKTRSSVRTTPALNTRSKGDKTQSNANILRRKTRSSVSEGEGKRRKDVK